MSVSKEEREAYERGQVQRDWDNDTSLPGVLWNIAGPTQSSGSTPDEQSAFDKGRHGEQLD